MTCRNQSISGRFTELIQRAHAQHGQPVAVLIDEYDKPILDNITDPVTARVMREGLKALYESIKYADEHLKFVFLTGGEQVQQGQPILGAEQPA